MEKREIGRKILRMIVGAIIISLILFVKNNYGEKMIILLGFWLSIILILLDMLRVEFNFFLPFEKHLIRKKEEKRINALTMGVIGGLLAFSFYRFDIAFAAIVMMLFSDPAAAIIGMKYGSIKLVKKKSLQGGATALIVNLIIGYIMLANAIIFIPMALTATIIELVADQIDDDFTIPLFAGLVGHLISTLV